MLQKGPAIWQSLSDEWLAYRPALSRRLIEPLQRHDQLPAPDAEGFEAVVAVERSGGIVLGIDHQGKYGDLRPGGTDGCVR